MDPYSPIIPEATAEGTYIEENVDLKPLPTTPVGEKMVEDQIPSPENLSGMN